jgi:LmbE family N-acetylglucosaminyl deacetylase
MKGSYRLLVVAHPDDEAIFFAGALLSKRDLPWHVLCLTDGNGSGRGAERHQEFLAATEILGAKKATQWDYQDKPRMSLPVDEIATRLSELPLPKEVFTHGPFGEYGHLHHQNCSLAVHRAFPKLKIFSPALNCNADFVVKLTSAQFRRKTRVYAEIYGKETSIFLDFLPNTPVEGYRRFLNREVEALADYLHREDPHDIAALGEHSWVAQMLWRIMRRRQRI